MTDAQIYGADIGTMVGSIGLLWLLCYLLAWVITVMMGAYRL